MASMPDGNLPPGQSLNFDPDGVMLDTAVDAESDTQRWFTSLSFMEVHTHMQAAALRLYPGRKLVIPPRSAHLKHFTKIRTVTTRDAPESYKFDVAQVWKIHSPSSYTTSYGFRRALTGENQDSPTSELDVGKYPSLEILRFFDSDRRTVVKFRPIMSAEDILRFMVSDFARKGQFDEIFEESESAEVQLVSTTPRLSSALEALPFSDPRVSSTAQRQPVKVEPGLAEQPPREHGSPRSVFSNSCLARCRELEQHFSTLADIEELEGPAGPAHDRANHKRRKLSIATMVSISKILFDANKLVLDTMLTRK
jgi:hypothetical protein